MLEPFNRVYRALFNKGYYPTKWRQAVGILLPKLGKRDYNIPKYYRIISLLNCLGKVLEKLFATRLSYLANIPTSNSRNLLDSTQLGGRKQRSAIDTVLLLTNYIQEQRARKKKASSNSITTALFLDVKGTFDHVSKPQLLSMLTKLQLPQALIGWVDSFLIDRKIQLAFEG